MAKNSVSFIGTIGNTAALAIEKGETSSMDIAHYDMLF